MSPACPGVEMCGSTATSTTSVPTGRYVPTAVPFNSSAPEAPPKAAARATRAATTRATTATASNNSNHTANSNINTSSSRASRGRKFQKKKYYIAKKEFAYKMCAGRPTSAMPKPFLCGNVTCFDVMKLLAGWDAVMWLVVTWRGVSYCG